MAARAVGPTARAPTKPAMPHMVDWPSRLRRWFVIAGTLPGAKREDEEHAGDFFFVRPRKVTKAILPPGRRLRGSCARGFVISEPPGCPHRTSLSLAVDSPVPRAAPSGARPKTTEVYKRCWAPRTKRQTSQTCKQGGRTGCSPAKDGSRTGRQRREGGGGRAIRGGLGPFTRQSHPGEGSAPQVAVNHRRR